MNVHQEIEKLRELGYTVRVSHRRPLGPTPAAEGGPFYSRETVKRFIPGAPFWPKGGQTSVIIQANPDDQRPVATGLATCSPSENFNRKLGLCIALGRALCELSGERERRDAAPRSWAEAMQRAYQRQLQQQRRRKT